MLISAHYHVLNSPIPRVYYSAHVTTHAQEDAHSNNTYNIDSYTISSYRLNFDVRTVARFFSGLKRLMTSRLTGQRLITDRWWVEFLIEDTKGFNNYRCFECDALFVSDPPEKLFKHSSGAPF